MRTLAEARKEKYKALEFIMQQMHTMLTDFLSDKVKDTGYQLTKEPLGGVATAMPTAGGRQVSSNYRFPGMMFSSGTPCGNERWTTR